MANLDIKIELYAAANGVASIDFENDVLLEQQFGEDVKIVQWNLSIDEPTAEQLASYETAATTEKTLQTVLNKRANEYPSLKEFVEAYTEKEINGNDTKWLQYKTKYNKVRTDNPKS